LLVGRRGPQTPGADLLRAELTTDDSDGADPRTVTADVVAADVGDADGVDAALAAVPPDRPLTAVVHAAGVGQTGPAAETSLAEAERITSVKLRGAELLDERLADHDLDAFVVTSSASGIWGGSYQDVYAAANAAIDGLIARRRACGTTGTAVALGVCDTGMTVSGNFEEPMRRH